MTVKNSKSLFFSLLVPVQSVQRHRRKVLGSKLVICLPTVSIWFCQQWVHQNHELTATFKHQKCFIKIIICIYTHLYLIYITNKWMETQFMNVKFLYVFKVWLILELVRTWALLSDSRGNCICLRWSGERASVYLGKIPKCSSGVIRLLESHSGSSIHENLLGHFLGSVFQKVLLVFII